MSVKLTDAQRRVVLSTGNVLVEAGAGSGKTTTVVQLLLHSLGVTIGEGAQAIAGAAQPMRLDHLAAITFTNAAAADLVRKMREALRQAGRADLATDVDAARLGTIHGFCGDLLRAYALRAKLPPGQRVLTDIEAMAVAREAARDVVHEALSAGELEGLSQLLSGRKLADVMEWVATLAQDTERLERWQGSANAPRQHERALLALAQAAALKRVERLDELAALDFDRMLVAARDLLRIDDVRRAVQRRLRLLVIDEFQDVDPVQQEIAMLLGGLARQDPAPTRLVLVGDPKQSIYRFRRADVTLWSRTAERFRGGAGEVLPLNENFRSKAALLGFVDRVIGTMMDRPLDPARGRQSYEVDFAPLLPRAAHAEGDDCVEIYALPPDEKGKPLTANPVRSAEQPAIAARLRELHESDGKRWGSMAVLVPSWGAADGIAAELSAAGVPAYVPRGEGFWDAREVLDCLLLLRVVRDPADDVAAVGVLKGPFIGVRDETLLALANARVDGESFVSAASRLAKESSLAESERALLDRAAGLIAQGARLRDRVAAAAYLDAVVRETGFLASLALMPGGDQRLANLRKLIRLLDSARDQSLGEFLREVREARARGDAVPAERLYGASGDVVTIMTVHSAKGLEWDVVVLADLAYQYPEPTAAMLPGRERIAVKDVDAAETDEGDVEYEALKAEESAEEMAQRLRVWYVAATRAREKMLLFTLPFGEQKTPRSAAAHFLAELGAPTIGGTLRYASHEGREFTARVLLAEGRVERAATSDAEGPTFALPPLARRAATGSSRLSATQLMTFARDPDAWRRIYVDRAPDLSSGSGDRRQDAAIQRAIVTGQIVHAVLEQLEEAGTDLEVLMEEAIGEWDASAPAASTASGLRMRDGLRERITRVASSAVWRETVESAGARRELAFTRVLPDGSALVGAMDLVAPRGDGVRVLDVKASTADAETLRLRYGVQAAVYVEAMRALRGVQDVEFLLLSASDGQATVVQPSVDLAALITTLRGQ